MIIAGVAVSRLVWTPDADCVGRLCPGTDRLSLADTVNVIHDYLNILDGPTCP